MALGVVASAPSSWDEAKRPPPEFQDAIAPTVERTADVFASGVGMVRDALGEPIEDATLTGSARIIDGDTLEVRGARVRLHGIDAPERK